MYSENQRKSSCFWLGSLLLTAATLGAWFFPWFGIHADMIGWFEGVKIFVFALPAYICAGVFLLRHRGQWGLAASVTAIFLIFALSIFYWQYTYPTGPDMTALIRWDNLLSTTCPAYWVSSALAGAAALCFWADVREL